MLGWLFSGPLPVGSQAPKFEAKDDAGHTVRLSELRGKNVVLVFYPGDNTRNCTAQLSEFRDSAREAQQKNTVVFGVNPADFRSHAMFREKNDFGFPLLVDTGRKIARAYNATGLIIQRTVYLIGPDGAIRYAQRGKPSVSDVLAHVA
jgi:peroxiredoxin Q/BCP